MTIIVYCSQVGYYHYPRQRKLSPEDQASAAEWMKLQANKKKIQDHFVKNGNNVVLLKDLHNIEAKNKPKTCGKTLVQQLKNIPGG